MMLKNKWEPAACSSDCVLCDGVGRCSVCRDRTYLMEGYCTPDCGPGYYAELKTRVCHGKNNFIKPRVRIQRSNIYFCFFFHLVRLTRREETFEEFVEEKRAVRRISIFTELLCNTKTTAGTKIFNNLQAVSKARHPTEVKCSLQVRRFHKTPQTRT